MIRTLVVDDEFGIRHIVKLVLNRMHIGVLEAETAAEALAVFEETRPDLVLMDLRLPDLSGMELTRRLRQVQPHLPIIFMSASTELGQAAEQSSATAYLEKPFKLAELQSLIQEMVFSSDAETTR